MSPIETSTIEDLLTTIRTATGCTVLAFADEPVPLTGGLFAEMVAFEFVDPPPELVGRLVARIVPDPEIAAHETIVQRYVATAGFATPDIMLSADASGPLGRAVSVMPFVDGRPLLAGLDPMVVLRQLPQLIRKLPRSLASISAALHALDPDPLIRALQASGRKAPVTTTELVQTMAVSARDLERPDLCAASERLAALEPDSDVHVICHGDLHPLNILATAQGDVLIDWSETRITHPAYDVAFTDLMLSHPPLQVGPALAWALNLSAQFVARSFRRAYGDLMPGSPALRPATLRWHHKLHALRILLALEKRRAAGGGEPVVHPWNSLVPWASAVLDLDETPS